MKITLFGSLFAASALLFASSTTATPLSFTLEVPDVDTIDTLKKGGDNGNIMDALRNDKRFRKVVKALEENQNRGLRDRLEGRSGRVTFFAPTDQAWENIEDVLDNIREDRRRRRDDDDRKGRDRDDDDDYKKGRKDRDDDDNKKGRKDRDRDDDNRRDNKDMQDILDYHIIRDEIRVNELYNGQLLKTNLEESRLGGKDQRVRVAEFAGQFYLNMYARVHNDEIRAENGNVIAIDHVMCPPMDLTEQMTLIPFEFSTMLVAARQTDVMRDMRDKEEMTIFAPTNHAWKMLGVQNLIYLFSPRGRDDLRKIVEYHVGKKVIYSTNMMKDGEIRVRTLNRDQELEINCEERKNRGDRDDRDRRDRDRDDRDRRDRDRDDRNRRDRDRDDRDDRDSRENPSNWIFTINNGEARIEHTDCLADNGVIQAINAVLIPSDVELPHSC